MIRDFMLRIAPGKEQRQRDLILARRAAAKLAKAEALYKQEIAEITKRAEDMHRKRVRHKRSGLTGEALWTWPDRTHALRLHMDDKEFWSGNPCEFEVLPDPPGEVP